jgi:type IV secretory pathway TrbD component
LLNKGSRAPFALAASLVLRELYRWLRRRGAGLATLGAAVVIGCLVLGAGVFVAHRATMFALGLIPAGIPFFDAHGTLRTIVEFAFALVAWSAAYFGVVFWQDAERREREAAQARADAAEAARLAREAQLEALAYQLNPHFLFNALSSLRALIDEDPARARRMVTELAGFFRYTMLERPLQTALLGDEIAALRDYLAIERIRFGERLVVEVDMEEAAARCTVPAFLVHPLVENALKHGGSTPPGGPLRLAIRAATRGERLAIEVWNSGELRAASAADAGLTGDTVGSLSPDLLRADRPRVGLRNVRARLERMFPDRHAFTLAARDGGVLARVELPCMPGATSRMDERSDAAASTSVHSP